MKRKSRDVISEIARERLSSKEELTVRAIRDEVLSRTGVSCSPNLVVSVLKEFRSNEVELPDTAHDPESPFGQQGQENNKANQDTKNLAPHGQSMFLSIAGSLPAFNESLAAQSEAIRDLNLQHSSTIKELAEDALRSLLQAQQTYLGEINKLVDDRRKDREQWEGLRKFLMQETDRIRAEESGKYEVLRKKIIDLETMLTHMTQSKNQAWEEVSKLQAQLNQRRDNANLSGTKKAISAGEEPVYDNE